MGSNLRVVFTAVALVSVTIGPFPGCSKKAPPPSSSPLSDASGSATPSAVASSTAAAVVSAQTPEVSHQPKPLSREQTEAFRRYEKALGRGRLATQRKQYDEAVKAFDEALAAVPGDFRALAERGYAKLVAGDLDGAEQDLHDVRGSSDVKLWAQVWFNHGLIAEMRGQPDRARDHFSMSYRLNPTKAASDKLTGKGMCPVRVDRLSPLGVPMDSWLAVWKTIAEPTWRELGMMEPAPTDEVSARKALQVGSCNRLCLAFVEGMRLHVIAPQPTGKLLVFPMAFESSVYRCGGLATGGESDRSVPSVAMGTTNYEYFVICDPNAAPDDPYPCRGGCGDGSWISVSAFLDPVGRQTLLRLEQTGPTKEGPGSTPIDFDADETGVRPKHPACKEPIPYKP